MDLSLRLVVTYAGFRAGQLLWGHVGFPSGNRAAEGSTDVDNSDGTAIIQLNIDRLDCPTAPFTTNVVRIGVFTGGPTWSIQLGTFPITHTWCSAR
jgi:hypothetical protein